MVNWEKNLEIGVKSIDQQHQMLIKALEDIYDACSKGEGLTQIRETAKFLEWYVVKHFSEEEEIQRKINYPGYAAHAKLHKKYIEEVNRLTQDLKKQEVTTQDISSVVQYLNRMIREHINRHDRALAHYIRNNEMVVEEIEIEARELDPLTGLLSRKEFRSLLENELVKSCRKELVYVVMKIDGFDEVNRTYGYTIGEEVLIYVSGILVEYNNERTLIGRNHQDEFVMCIREADKDKIEHMLEDIAEKIYAGFKRRGSIIPLALKMGIVEIAEGSKCQKCIKQQGLIALSVAETFRGSNRVCFKEEMHEQILRKSEIINMLQPYSLEKYLYVVYQPIFDLKNNKVKGCEALLRMKDDYGNMISPGEFIPLAEKNNLIIDVGDYCMREVFRQVKQFLQAGINLEYISINLSIEQFKLEGLAKRIEKMAQVVSVDLKHIYFELTESIMIENFDHIKTVVSQLKDLGCRILLDDFGSGYSALSYLAHVDTNIIKIDKSLLEGIGTNKQVYIVLENIIKLIKAMNKNIVVEGVEKKEELDILRQLDAETIQGYYISKPLECDSVIELIKKLN